MTMKITNHFAWNMGKLGYSDHPPTENKLKISKCCEENTKLLDKNLRGQGNPERRSIAMNFLLF